MTPMNEPSNYGRNRVKRFAVAGIVTVLIAGAVWLLVSRHKPSAAASSSGGDMAGMPGMSSNTSSNTNSGGSGAKGGSMAGMAGMKIGRAHV